MNVFTEIRNSSTHEMDPSNKVALVTGAAQGLGLAIVKELLRNGVKGVSVCDIQETKGRRTVHQLQEDFGVDRVIFIKTDVTDENELKETFEQTVKKFEGLHIVINNAGKAKEVGWQLSVKTNINAVIQGTMLALEYMGKDKGGTGGIVVNMSSLAGLGAGLAVMPVYNATKHAVIGLTRSFGAEYFVKMTGVRVVAICPGFTYTEAMEEDDKEELFTLQVEWMPELNRLIQGYKPQKSENVGKGVLHIIREAPSGSIWISCEDQPTYQIKIPDYKDLERVQC